MPGVFFGILRGMPLLSEDDLCRSPQWYPLRFASRDSVLFVELSEEAYRAASFLDERLLAGNPSQATCELDAMGSAAARLESSAFYLFHIGHVGSTLISRLIGCHERLFSIREPALLRAFADPAARPAAPSLERLLALLSRTWKPDQRAVIKATSIVNEAAEAILRGHHRPAAIFMYTAPVNYLRGILGGPNSRVESKALAPGRQRRLEQRLGVQVVPPVLSEGEQIAMNWLSEMTVLHQAAMRFQAQVLWADFDEFLRNPVGGLGAMFRALGVEYSEKEIESLIAGPIMRQYSKAPEHHYDAALRREVFQSADWQHGGEIKRGLSWLGQAAAASALVEAVLIGASQRGKF
jgi:hypothetical protein